MTVKFNELTFRNQVLVNLLTDNGCDAYELHGSGPMKEVRI